MSSSTTLPVTGPCRACLAQIQNSPNHLVNENTPLIYTRRRPANSRCPIILFGLLMFILFVGCTIGFYLITIETRDIEPQDVIMFASRHNWRAEYVTTTKDLVLPCHNLLLVYTNSSPCYDHHTCAKEMRDLQKTHMLSNHSDLLYNFVIANDNRIYEGRGWKYASDIAGYTDNTTISVGFLDYPGNSVPTTTQTNQLMSLINLSITNRKMIHCFSVSTKPDEKSHFQDILNRIQHTFIDTRCF